MKVDKILIACGIFKDEIKFLLERKRGLSDIEVIWLDAGLHSDLKLLESELSSAIDNAKTIGNGDVKILYGNGCLPQIKSIADSKGVHIIPTKNCLSAFLGEEKSIELEQNNTMLMTPSWVRVWPANMKRFFGWNEVDFRMNLGRYERILVLDSGVNSLTEDEILEFFDLVQVPVEFMNLNLDHFDNILNWLLE
jgi:hypothetical protein